MIKYGIFSMIKYGIFSMTKYGIFKIRSGNWEQVHVVGVFQIVNICSFRVL